MIHPTNHIFEHTPETLAAWCEKNHMPGFRAKQIIEWVYEKGVADPAKMTNLSKLDRDRLAAGMTFVSGDILRHQSATDGTQKLLVQWRDSGSEPGLATGVGLPVLNNVGLDAKRQTECVMIPSEDRRTACISSQVGCPVGCRFCASGLGGLDGNLSAGRIVEQVWLLRAILRGEGTELAAANAAKHAGGPAGAREERISNVVFMGMGEPLSNFDAVTRAIRILSSLWATGISARKITISTVGLPKYIERLANEFELPVTLALSLHAPTDAIRRELIPWAEYTTIDQLLAACQKWFDKTGREITLEYTLLRGVNDKPEHAIELAALCKRLRANVNLIRYNEVAGLPFKRPRTDDVHEFQRLIRDRNVNVHIRASRGRDIAAACGQLRHDTAAESGGVEAAPEISVAVEDD